MRSLIALAFFGVAVAAVGCTSTTFTSTWKAPDAQVLDPAGRRVAAVFISKDESSRRVAEDTMVRRLQERGAEGIASYTVIPTDALRDLDKVRASLAEAGVEGVVIMRVIGQKERISSTSPRPTFAPYYWRFSQYWNYGWGVAYVPSEVRTDTILSMETLVYSLRDDKLLWAGTSRTTNPDDIDELVTEVAAAAAKQMAAQGLLANAEAPAKRS
jgi:hypothetical protein